MSECSIVNWVHSHTLGARLRNTKKSAARGMTEVMNRGRACSYESILLRDLDLVKSHLMFAVREEVDVLKEQIKELLEKNQQLEQENNALKAAAPPEVLQQLSTQTQTQTQPPTSSS